MPRTRGISIGLRVGALLSVSTACTLVGCAAAAITPLPREAPHPVDVPAPVSQASSGLGAGTSRSITAVRRTIDSLLDQSGFRTATWSALVLGPTGDTIYARDAAKLLIPASNMKLVTTAVALVQLGADFRFRDTAIALPLGDTVPSDFGQMYDTLFVRDHPLREVLPKLLKPSQNRLAEELFETLALERTGVIARDSAIAVERRQLGAWQIPADGYIIHDGSGYDRANYLSAETLTHILLAMRSDTAFAVWYNALPIAGIDGTLIRRMRATAATQNVHAKTGSLQSIRALSGYVTTANGAQLTFSFLCNAFTTPAQQVTDAMDQAVIVLAGMSLGS
jgi:D-alanyl-D-alanine carboxypeptidase